MKKNNWVTLFFLALFSGVIIFFFVINIDHKKLLEREVVQLKGSVEKIQVKDLYLSNLFEIANRENNKKHSFDGLMAYKLIDGKPQFPKELSSLFKTGESKLVIRYTEIGCNACTDSTLKIIKQKNSLWDKYDVYILVDFSNYDAYLKWKKIAEIDYPVLWVKKGDLPFDIELQEVSYLFTVNNSLTVNDFFVPNSRFPIYIHNYISGLESKL